MSFATIEQRVELEKALLSTGDKPSFMGEEIEGMNSYPIQARLSGVIARIGAAFASSNEEFLNSENLTHFRAEGLSTSIHLSEKEIR